MRVEGGKLAGKTALITGAGSGIGYAIAKRFVSEGAQIAAIARRDEGLAKWQDIENAVPIRADISRRDEIEAAVDQAEHRFGKLDIVCNVAGIHDLLYPLHETSDDLWEAVINTDLRAPFQICRAAMKGMLARQSGVILNIGSLVAYRGLHGPSYCAAKAGLLGMTLSIAVRYARNGIRCNAINPGPIETEITTTSGGQLHVQGWEMLSKIESALPIRWMGKPDDVASTALFLCSDDARHVNGAVLPVDGGWSAC